MLNNKNTILRNIIKPTISQLATQDMPSSQDTASNQDMDSRLHTCNKQYMASKQSIANKQDTDNKQVILKDMDMGRHLVSNNILNRFRISTTHSSKAIQTNKANRITNRTEGTSKADTRRSIIEERTISTTDTMHTNTMKGSTMAIRKEAKEERRKDNSIKKDTTAINHKKKSLQNRLNKQQRNQSPSQFPFPWWNSHLPLLRSQSLNP